MDTRPKSWVEFGKRIRARRKARGWTQERLADELGTGDRTVRFLEAGERPLPLNLTEAIKRVLGFSASDLRAAFGENSADLVNVAKGYRMCSFAEAARICGSFEALDGEFLRIEESYPVPTEDGEYGDPQKWVQLLRTTPETGGCLLYQEKKIVGYWQCFVVENSFYERIVSGENVNNAITTDDVVVVGEEGLNFNLFFISLFVEYEHTNPILNHMIFHHFAMFLLNAARAGMFFRRIAANITGRRARTLCARRGFQKRIDHPMHRYPLNEGGGLPRFLNSSLKNIPAAYLTQNLTSALNCDECMWRKALYLLRNRNFFIHSWVSFLDLGFIQNEESNRLFFSVTSIGRARLLRSI